MSYDWLHYLIILSSNEMFIWFHSSFFELLSQINLVAFPLGRDAVDSNFKTGNPSDCRGNTTCHVPEPFPFAQNPLLMRFSFDILKDCRWDCWQIFQYCLFPPTLRDSLKTIDIFRIVNERSYNRNLDTSWLSDMQPSKTLDNGSLNAAPQKCDSFPLISP